MKDAKGHGSNTRGGSKLPRGTTAAYAGRDRLGRTYTSAIRDYDRFRSQNPDFPNAEDYRTDKTSNAQAAEALASTLKSTQAPVHDAMVTGDGRSHPDYQSAVAHANSVHAKTGVFISVEKQSRKK